MPETLYHSETVQPGSVTFDSIQVYLYKLYANRRATPDYLFLEESDYDALIAELTHMLSYVLAGGNEIQSSIKDISHGKKIASIISYVTGKPITIAHIPDLAPGSIMVLYQEHVWKGNDREVE